MQREYAVYEKQGGTWQMLAKTEGFREDLVTDTIALSEEKTLQISGTDPLVEINRQLQEKNESLEAANRAKETFLSNMSHDIRTPMNAIVGMTALAKKHIDEKTKVMDSLNKIEVASGHLLSLINEVLDMSRIDSGRMKITEEIFSLSDLLHETLTISRPQAKQKNHTFTFKTGTIRYENLYGDTLHLRQVFLNIINNAVKYTEENGKIDVFVTQEMQDDRCALIFSCRDNGIGMSPAFLKKIYEPFERAGSANNSKIEGTGLGMSIVKKLVEAMDGTIDIESELNKGTKVTICIPMHFETIEIDTDALSGKQLLILEKDPGLQKAYQRYLNEMAVDLHIVNSSSQAVEALADADFENRMFDALMIGNEMDSSGSIFDIASYVHKAYPDLPIILISEQDWNQIEYHAVRCGMETFIPIPFFRKSLIRGLTHALKQDSENTASFAGADLKGRRILLVEDNPINLEIAREILSMTNAEIDTAENGQEAVEAFESAEENRYDLILMDVQMPIMDGYTAVKKIRALERNDAKKVLIYAMTANTFAEDIEKAHKAGMNGHIAKPIDINKLMTTLRQIL